jgi:hypothetical protein
VEGSGKSGSSVSSSECFGFDGGDRKCQRGMEFKSGRGRVPAPEIPRWNGWLRFLRQSAGDRRKFRNREVRRRGAATHSANIHDGARLALPFTTEIAVVMTVYNCYPLYTAWTLNAEGPALISPYCIRTSFCFLAENLLRQCTNMCAPFWHQSSSEFRLTSQERAFRHPSREAFAWTRIATKPLPNLFPFRRGRAWPFFFSSSRLARGWV